MRSALIDKLVARQKGKLDRYLRDLARQGIAGERIQFRQPSGRLDIEVWIDGTKRKTIRLELKGESPELVSKFGSTGGKG